MIKRYSDKVPLIVRHAMAQCTQEDCYLVKRRIRGLTGAGVQGNCHLNVQRWVDSVGGERVPGWLLYRNRRTLNSGIWVWSFHSVWRTPEGETVDVTQDETYSGSEFTTVWFDKTRDIDLVQGMNYNNVVVFERESTVAALTQTLGFTVTVGTPYWTTRRLDRTLSIDQHSGQYRWVDIRDPDSAEYQAYLAGWQETTDRKEWT